MERTSDRVEHFEGRSLSRVGRSQIVAVPPEDESRLGLTQLTPEEVTSSVVFD